MTLEEIAAKLTEALSGAGGIDQSVKFDFGDDGQICANGDTATVADDDADCTISISLDDFLALTKGDLDPMGAFMTGKLKIAGDMSVAMGLQSLFANM